RMIGAGRFRGAGAEAAVNLAVGVDKQGGAHHVVVEVEDVEGQAAHVAELHEDKLPRRLVDFGMEASNLLAETTFVGSGMAVEEGEDRLAGALGFLLGGGEVAKPRRRLLSAADAGEQNRA